ncbi:coenzyme F420 hydrogenase/dehydrogenase beta subunit N-terminal domain-containing protein [Halochromatium glycolicum]|uniref:coenzyme F420 hydrogenase/dehydrogenase beta subunit N-terminal domain-containing protein n=1 Tax=Halochromatium glycolicum TaxID=85075 RepID=UPI0030B7F9DC
MVTSLAARLLERGEVEAVITAASGRRSQPRHAALSADAGQAAGQAAEADPPADRLATAHPRPARTGVRAGDHRDEAIPEPAACARSLRSLRVTHRAGARLSRPCALCRRVRADLRTPI